MLSDLSEYHRINVFDAIRGGTHSPRVLLALLATLPDDSALAASVRGEPRGWGSDRHLLASLIDAVQINTWITAKAAGSRKPKPKPLARPQRMKKRVVVSVADLLDASDN